MSNAKPTLEQRFKDGPGLPRGRSLIEVKRGHIRRRAVCDISPRGIVHVLVKPEPDAMYSSWYRVRGDDTKADRSVLVWGARNPDVMAMFDGAPVACVEL